MFPETKKKLPLCLSAGAVAMLLRKTKNVIFSYVSDKTNFNSNESILQQKPAESDFHVHARTRRIRSIFPKPFRLILYTFMSIRKRR